MAWTQADAKKIWPWLLPLSGPPGHITQRFKGGFSGSGENGIDIGLPPGTPVTSLTAGQVLTNGYYGGGGVVTVESTLPLGIGVASVYYQHLDLNNPAMVPGHQVKVGEVIGWSGGQLSGGHHPSSRAFSSGPHIEIGINAPFSKNGLWHPLGPNIDPMPWLETLVAHGPNTTDIISSQPVIGTPLSSATATVRGTGPVAESWTAIEQRLDELMQFAPLDTSNLGWQDYLPWNWQEAGNKVQQDVQTVIVHDIDAFILRSLFILVGIVIIIAFFVNLMMGAVEKVQPLAGGIAAGAGAAAAFA